DHLHRRISIRGHCLELLHSSLRLNLVWFLHSDSPFSPQKKLLSAYQRLRAGSRYFLRSTGHSQNTQAAPEASCARMAVGARWSQSSETGLWRSVRAPEAQPWIASISAPT